MRRSPTGALLAAALLCALVAPPAAAKKKGPPPLRVTSISSPTTARVGEAVSFAYTLDNNLLKRARPRTLLVDLVGPTTIRVGRISTPPVPFFSTLEVSAPLNIPTATTGNYTVRGCLAGKRRKRKPNCATGNGISITGSSRPSSTTATRPSISISPTSYDFGQVTDYSDQTFTVTNIGSLATTIAARILTGSSSFSIVVDGCTGATMQPGGQCPVVVRCDPEFFGPVFGILSATATTNSISRTVNAGLTGTGA